MDGRANNLADDRANDQANDQANKPANSQADSRVNNPKDNHADGPANDPENSRVDNLMDSQAIGRADRGCDKSGDDHAGTLALHSFRPLLWLIHCIADTIPQRDQSGFHGQEDGGADGGLRDRGIGLCGIH